MVAVNPIKKFEVIEVLAEWVLKQPNPYDWIIISACPCGCGTTEFIGPIFQEMPHHGETIH